MSEVVEFQKSLTIPELEMGFAEAYDALLIEWQGKGMTACWQLGVVEQMNLQMREPE